MKILSKAVALVLGLAFGWLFALGIRAAIDNLTLQTAMMSQIPACHCPQPSQPNDTNSEDDYWPDAMAPVTWPRIVWPEMVRERMNK